MIKSLRARLKLGETVYGSWLSLGSSLTAEIMARAGFDWLVIDMEHGAGDFRDLVAQLQAIEATPTVPIVRVAINEPWLFKRTLDQGPSGLLIPLVETAEDTRAVVRAMSYPPKGIRGVAASTRAAGYGSDFAEYFARAGDLLLTVVQIERGKAVENIEEIAAIPEVDVLFVGPVDLTVALGVPNQLDSEVAQSALRRIEAAARRHGKVLGILLPRWEQAVQYRDRGYRFIGVGGDGVLLNQAARSLVAAMKSTGAS